ncbi:MAG TPA: cytochrome C oxidase subunit IV family protein [Anaerolineales bacterium]|nr:cytochrome C oxidase subunit IV family protein [Anaerolineales bacterium]
METEKRPNYLYIFIALAVFTLVETLVSYVQQEAIKVSTLVILSVIKVLLVLLYFMHLKTDSKVYSYLFIAGCVLSIPLILVLTVVMPMLG